MNWRNPFRTKPTSRKSLPDSRDEQIRMLELMLARLEAEKDCSEWQHTGQERWGWFAMASALLTEAQKTELQGRIERAREKERVA